MLRCFWAVRIPLQRPIQRLLAEFRRAGRCVRAVDAENLHVTVKFLGPTPREQVAGIANAVAVRVATKSAFQLELNGLGAFPSPQRPRVIWAGAAPIQEIRGVAGLCESACESFGFAPERRPFHPHVTLARVNGRPPERLLELMGEFRDAAFGLVQVEQLELMQSESGRRGPRYSTLAHAPLTGRGG